MYAAERKDISTPVLVWVMNLNNAAWDVRPHVATLAHYNIAVCQCERLRVFARAARKFVYDNVMMSNAFWYDVPQSKTRLLRSERTTADRSRAFLATCTSSASPLLERRNIHTCSAGTRTRMASCWSASRGRRFNTAAMGGDLPRAACSPALFTLLAMCAHLLRTIVFLHHACCRC